MTAERSISRRRALQIGGLSVSMAALAAACGENRGPSPELGRVGNADSAEPLGNFAVTPAVLHRPASSLEYTANEVYETVLGRDGVIPTNLVPLINEFIENHTEIAVEMEALTEAAGGTPWSCTNPWLMDRLVAPTIESIQSNVVGLVLEDTAMVQVMGEELEIADVVTTTRGELALVSDVDDVSAGDEIEFARLEGAVTEDVLAFANALENLAAASHQMLVALASTIDARIAHANAAQLEARHAAKLSIDIDGARVYVAPTMVGEEAIPTERGRIRQYAIPSAFATTSQIEIKAGPADLNNVRQSVVLQTPAANSFVYEEDDSCSA